MSTRLQPHESGDRRCLKCGKTFPSKHAGNRICKTCSKVNATIRISEAQLALERGAKRLNGIQIETGDSYTMDFMPTLNEPSDSLENSR